MSNSNISFAIYQKRLKSVDGKPQLIIRGIATTNTKDRDEEKVTITPNALAAALPDFRRRNSPVRVDHNRNPDFGEKNVGQVLDFEYFPKEYDLDAQDLPPMRIYAVCLIYDEKVINMILSGEYNAFSLGWSFLSDKVWMRSDGSLLYTDIIIDELTVCSIPCNPDAYFSIVTDDSLIEQYEFANYIGEEVEVKESQGKMVTKVKSLFVDDYGTKFYQLENDNNLYQESEIELSQKAFTVQTDTSAIDRVLKKSLRKKIRDEKYDIGINNVKDLSYATSRFKVTFGDNNNRHSTEISVNSSGQVTFHTKITNANQKEKGIDPNASGFIGVYYEPTDFSEVTSNILTDDLSVVNNKDKDYIQDGLPKDYHTTLLYGFLPNVKESDVIKILSQYPSGGDRSYIDLISEYTPTIKELSVFEQEDQDILIIKLDSPLYQNINQELRKLDYENEYEEYVPHITLAYLKKGVAYKYLPQLDVSKIQIRFASVVFVPANKEKELIIKNKAVTDFPRKGWNKKVSLRNSKNKVFDPEYVKNLKEKYPQIWKKGGNIKGNSQFKKLSKVLDQGKVETQSDENAVRLREAWAARHLRNSRVAGVVAQMKWFVTGSKGARYMKNLINKEKRKIDAKK